MPTDLLIRILWALAIILAGWALYRLLTRLSVSRAQGKARGLVRLGTPAILFFTTPDCAPCKTVQRPAIQRVQNRLGEGLQVVEVDAYAQPELAKAWGVLSVPTTFIIDSAGKPRHVNYGVTPAERLLEQVKKFGKS
jgi:thiol-disulfide isomerase/thioredoxin